MFCNFQIVYAEKSVYGQWQLLYQNYFDAYYFLNLHLFILLVGTQALLLYFKLLQWIKKLKSNHVLKLIKLLRYCIWFVIRDGLSSFFLLSLNSCLLPRYDRWVRGVKAVDGAKNDLQGGLAWTWVGCNRFKIVKRNWHGVTVVRCSFTPIGKWWRLVRKTPSRDYLSSSYDLEEAGKAIEY